MLLMALSACFGIIMGAIPGLSGTLGIALLLPFTFGLEPGRALLMLGAVYCGSEYGGSIPSILINTPGTAAALCTTFDGHPMARNGQAQKALLTALLSSVFGGLFGVCSLVFLSVPLARVAMSFGAPEQFWLCVFALTIIASLSSGHVLKGIIGALLGLLLACVGMDPITGIPRWLQASRVFISPSIPLSRAWLVAWFTTSKPQSTAASAACWGASRLG